MSKRVFELARELDVRSKDVLEKCRAEGIDVKNHMSSVSAGLEETIRDWFSEDEQGGARTAVETTEHVDLAEARAKAAKDRRRRRKEQAEEAAAQAEAQSAEPQEAPAPVAEAPPAEAPPETTEPAPAPEAPARPAEPPVEPAEPETLQPTAQPPQREAPTVAEEPPDDGEPPEEPQKPKEVKPAGPQVVPKPAQLKGPRVVRVEKPDYAPKPQPRQPVIPDSPPPLGRSRGSLKDERKQTEDGDDSKSRRATRRSPRRKSGRSADSGEKVKEWRNADLQERSQRIAGAGHSLRRHRAAVSRKGGSASGAGARSGKVEIEEPITIKSLSATTGLKSAEIIKKLMGMGTMATINQVIDTELAETICTEYDIELAVARARTAEEELMERLEQRAEGDKATRAPVVTFLGHVDHGKTSLLDHIRQTTVATGEAGGITQAIGAYRHDVGDQHVVFLDTPGHEAFTAMRARGANMTDVVVLVVAADDGVMPQTVEAINHAKAAGVPIVVALNKVDLPNANVNKALGQLAEHDLQPQQWGGNTEVIETSAETGQGINDLVELLSLEAEVLELQAEADAPATGYVVEARMDPGQGVFATLLVRNGTLKIGDVLLAGGGYGRVRQIYSDKGQPLEQAGPSTPVAVTGLGDVPVAGDRFFTLDDLDAARKVAEERFSADRAKLLAAQTSTPRSLEELLGKIEEGETNEIPIVLKADVQGSLEAIIGVLGKLGSDETRLNILHAAVGGISTGDVTLAEASGAIIIGFNVIADPQARRLAEEKKIDIRLYRVIYDITEDMRRALEEGLAPEIREETLGQAEIRQTFKISRLGTIAGCYVTEGVAQRNARVRVIRDNVVLEGNRELDSLKRGKDDAREVRAGLECGLKIKGYDDVKEGDVLEFYQTVEVARTL